jgi:hypothetical protein
MSEMRITIKIVENGVVVSCDNPLFSRERFFKTTRLAERSILSMLRRWERLMENE